MCCNSDQEGKYKNSREISTYNNISTGSDFLHNPAVLFKPFFMVNRGFMGCDRDDLFYDKKEIDNNLLRSMTSVSEHSA
jgi:hypothetical protein